MENVGTPRPRASSRWTRRREIGRVRLFWNGAYLRSAPSRSRSRSPSRSPDPGSGRGWREREREREREESPLQKSKTQAVCRAGQGKVNQEEAGAAVIAGFGVGGAAASLARFCEARKEMKAMPMAAATAIPAMIQGVCDWPPGIGGG